MKRFLPVLHIKNLELTQAQVAVAVENGADGIFLIDHSGSDSAMLLAHFGVVRHERPDLWVGLNFLGISAHAAMRIVGNVTQRSDIRIDGLWADNAGITDEGASPETQAVWEMKNQTEWAGQYFGSVAFKVGPKIQDPANAAAVAKPWMDVVVTSGIATGVAPDVEKLRRMKVSLGDKRLALASGITCENVREFLPYIDDFMVATGISRDFHRFDPELVQRMAVLIHEDQQSPPRRMVPRRFQETSWDPR